MDGKKRPTALGLDSAHEIIRRRLHENLPAKGDRVLTITVDEVLTLLSEYYWMKGQIEGLQSGGTLLKEMLENRK